MTVTSRLGRVRPIHRGAWSPAAAYEPLDIVTYNNRSFFCIQPATNVLPTNTTYWSVIADPSGVTVSVGKGLTIDGAVAGSADLSKDRFLELAVLPETKASLRNRLLNSAFQVCQDRATGATVTISTDGYAFDGVTLAVSGGGSLVCSQVLKTTPGGARTRFRASVGTADTALAATDRYVLIFPVEGVDVADLMFGTASAKSFSFRAVLPLPAGLYNLSFTNNTFDRSYVIPFTVTAAEANSDKLVTAVVPGDTLGTWLKDTTGIGLQVRLCLACGTSYQTSNTGAWQTGNYLATPAQTNAMFSAGNVFEVADIGLYPGTELPDWELPDYKEDLIACLRYFRTGILYGYGYMNPSGMYAANNERFGIPMRVVPSISVLASPAIAYSNCSAVNFVAVAKDGFTIAITVTTPGNFNVTGSYSANSRL